MVTKGARLVYAAMSWALVAAIPVQVYLAGLAIFGGADFEAHLGLGYALGGVAILQLLSALIARAPRRLIAMTGLLLVLMHLQPVFAVFGRPPDGFSALGALHPTLVLVMFVIALVVASRAHALAGASLPAPIVAV